MPTEKTTFPKMLSKINNIVEIGYDVMVTKIRYSEAIDITVTLSACVHFTRYSSKYCSMELGERLIPDAPFLELLYSERECTEEPEDFDLASLLCAPVK